MRAISFIKHMYRMLYKKSSPKKSHIHVLLTSAIFSMTIR